MLDGYLSSQAGFYNLARLEDLTNQHRHMTIDLDSVNLQLRDASAETIVRWALDQGLPSMASTSFGRNAAVMLHLVSSVDKSVPTVWVDTGYNLRDTYIVAERLINDLQLKMHIYAPQMTSERRNAIMGGVPTIEDEELHEEFTRQVKLEPFARAIEELKPQIWLTGIRREETEHRQGLDVVSRDGRGIVKVAPIFNWSEQDLEDYMELHSLPTCRHYFDPTKVHDGRECGLHTAA
jgi:phosphoadenosine phosphosulfate reductase